MRASELYGQLKGACCELYGEREASQIGRIMLEELTSITPTKLLIEPNIEIEVEHLDRILEELAAARPMQYILGRAEFCSRSFVVREGVLIPRPETEELVAMVIKQSQTGQRIVDVGTGSGAIAISVAKGVVGCRVEAIDISREALEIARENAERLGVDVTFVEGDALKGIEHYIDSGVDVVISNPPYIPQCESEQMRSNVTQYEPHLALFVSDDDPLIFYRAISLSALKILKSGGRLYFEIHEEFAADIELLLDEMGYSQVEIVKDINEKDRIACAVKR